MPSLSELYLDQNQLTGPLQFQNISSSQLNTLRLSGNKLDGSVPRSIANFTKLQWLYLSSINLKDKMELNIFFQVKELQFLDLSVNNLLVSKGNINSSLHKFSYLLLICLRIDNWTSYWVFCHLKKDNLVCEKFWSALT
ncbi:receptor-like protein 33 [Quercus suber]|uniref:Receptor-like protein 33 n=1 Tax=Quercus suber TaxID=58331 RepID=A0AAW0LB11_QUESU